MKPPATSAVAAEEASSGVCHAVGTGSGTSSGTGLPMAPAGTAAGMGGMTAGNRAHFHRAPGTRHPLLLRQHYPAHSPASCLTQKIPLYPASMQPSCSNPLNWGRGPATHRHTRIIPLSGPESTKGAWAPSAMWQDMASQPQGGQSLLLPLLAVQAAPERSWYELTAVIMEISHSSFYYRVTIGSYEKLKLIWAGWFASSEHNGPL